MIAQDDIAVCSPSHELGGYRSWMLPLGAERPFDMAWTSRVGHEESSPHHLLPFSEPSIAIRRRFDGAGETREVDLVLYAGAPDGGTYAPAGGEEIFALRLCPEHLETSLRACGIEYFSSDRELPIGLARLLAPAYELAERGRFAEAWRAMGTHLALISDSGEQDRVGHAAALFRRAEGAVGPAQLAQRAEVSPRHLRREFLRRYGLSPRAWRRRLRLTRAMTGADHLATPNWAGVALAAGYSDQSHMIRDCREITGMTPTQMHGLRRRMAETFNT
ncbi:MAG: helix-turn-helix transcriptional regulator [Erythrobacter sp.]